MPASTAPIAFSTSSYKLSPSATVGDATPQTNHSIPQSTSNSSSNYEFQNTQTSNTFIPEGLPLPETCAHTDDRIQQFLDEKIQDQRLQTVQAQVKKSLVIIEEALERYSLPELSLSYNGGKDCLVLLILYLSALHRKGILRHHLPPQEQAQQNFDTQEHVPASPSPNTFTLTSSSTSTSTSTSKSASTASTSPEQKIDTTNDSTPARLQSVYIQATHPFPSVENFVTTTSAAYNLRLTRLRPPMKSGFATYLASHPSVSAIFVGTRRTDPHGADLRSFQRTDHGWPDFVRIHPVLEWRYGEIWAFIRHLGIPYCPLYDAGFTSLGGTNDTHPNPALRLQHEPASPSPYETGTKIETETAITTATIVTTAHSNNIYNATTNANTISNGDSHDATVATATAASTTLIYRPAYELQDDELERLGRD